MNELLKVNEVARCLGIGRTTAYKLIRTGVLPCVRIGRAVRVEKAVLRGWVHGLATGIAPQQEALDDAR